MILHSAPIIPSARARPSGLLRSALTLLSLLALSACNDGSAVQTQPRQDVQRPRGGSFRITQVAPTSLDPAKMADSYQAALVNQIYEGLLSTDSNFNIRPGLAESWHISRDGLTYTFRLKHGVKFHDGTELTSSDVLFSLSRIFRTPEDVSYLAREYLGLIDGVDEYARGESDHVSGLTPLGRYDLRISLAHPSASFLAVLASEPARIVPRDYVLENGVDILDHKPVGCGPFVLAEWKEGDAIVLKRFENYHRAPAYLDELVFHIPIDNAKQRAVQNFLNGEDNALELTTGRLSEVANMADMKIYRRQELSMSFLGFNTTAPPFDRAEVRRAFACAINLDALPSLREGGRVKPNGMLPPGFPGYTPDSKMPVTNPTLSRRLLRDAGYVDGQGLPPIIHGFADPSDADIALIEGIAAQVARVGFDLQWRATSWDDFDRNLREASFQTFSLTWVADIPDPDSFFYPLFHSGASVNYTGYASQVVDDLLDSGRRGTTDGPRIASYRKVERVLLEDLPVFPLNHSLAIIGVRGNVQDFQMTPMGFGNLALEEIWLAPSAAASEVAR
jgi:peptide/nickel transport system substrate-binding protein